MCCAMGASRSSHGGALERPRVTNIFLRGHVSHAESATTTDWPEMPQVFATTFYNRKIMQIILPGLEPIARRICPLTRVISAGALIGRFRQVAYTLPVRTVLVWLRYFVVRRSQRSHGLYSGHAWRLHGRHYPPSWLSHWLSRGHVF